MGRQPRVNDRMNPPSLNEYATAEDFQKLFASEMVDLFRLAFLLTADAEKAEQCLIVTMNECMGGGSVYKWWLPVWTRNVLIRNGIRMVTGSEARPRPKIPRDRVLSAIRSSQAGAIDASDESVGILQLSDFDRLVYVIYFVEHYSTRDCAMLLGRSRQEVRDAQDRGFAQVVAFEREWRRTFLQLNADCFPPPDAHGAGTDGPCGVLLS